MIDIDTIISRYEHLNSELRIALSTMEKSDRVKEIRDAIHENQAACPHASAKYNWTMADNRCPYCGFDFGGKNNANN